MVDKWLPSWEPVFKALMTPVTSSRASASEDDDMSELWFVGTEGRFGYIVVEYIYIYKVCSIPQMFEVQVLSFIVYNVTCF